MNNLINERISFPPPTISDMRSILLAMDQGELELPMGRKSRAAFEQVLENPKVASMLSITALADTLNVSTATLTRLSRLLGFSSFKQFQNIFRAEMVGSSDFYSNKIKTRKTPILTPNSLIATAKDNILELEQELDAKRLTTICKAILSAEVVHCFGYRQTFSLASFLCYGLGMIRQRVQLINTTSQGLAFSIAQIKANDVLIGFGFHPYSSRTVKLMQLAKELNVPMIVITDSLRSPIAKITKNVLLVPVQSDFFSNSLVAPSLLIEIILSKLASMMGENSLKQLEQRETLINKLNDEY